MSASENRSTGGTGARARALLAALSLLVIGAVIGIAADRHLHSSEPHSNPAAAFHEMAMSSLEDRVELTAAQRRQIDSIMAARHETLSHTWQTLHTHLLAAADTVHEEIEAVLTPEQRAEFREWLRGVSGER